jgi:hypothetical protein
VEIQRTGERKKMATRQQTVAKGREKTFLARGEAPRSLSIAQKGITTGNHFAGFMSALMADLIEGRITPGVGNATCNAGGKLLKVVEMQAKYGQTGHGTNKTLLLTEAG